MTMPDLSEASAPDRLMRLDRDGALALLTFQQPQTLNAITAAFARELGEHLARLAADDGVRALLIRGEGRAFMAGGDLNYLRAAGPADAPAQADGVITPFHEAMRFLVALPFPVVAQVHGAVAGAGLSIMLACDFAVAADDTRFAFAYSRIATNPDGGLSWLLPRAIGTRRAMRLAFVEDVIGTAEAVGLGLVTQSVPAAALEDTARAFAATLAEKPTRAFAETKRLMGAAHDRSLDAQLDAERDGFCRSAATSDFHEGIAAFFEKRPAVFNGR